MEPTSGEDARSLPWRTIAIVVTLIVTTATVILVRANAEQAEQRAQQQEVRDAQEDLDEAILCEKLSERKLDLARKSARAELSGDGERRQALTRRTNLMALNNPDCYSEEELREARLELEFPEE